MTEVGAPNAKLKPHGRGSEALEPPNFSAFRLRKEPARDFPDEPLLLLNTLLGRTLKKVSILRCPLSSSFFGIFLFGFALHFGCTLDPLGFFGTKYFSIVWLSLGSKRIPYQCRHWPVRPEPLNVRFLPQGIAPARRFAIVQRGIFKWY